MNDGPFISIDDLENHQPKKLISEFYSANKRSINLNKIKIRLDLKQTEIKTDNGLVTEYYINHNPKYSYLVKTYFIWKNLPKAKRSDIVFQFGDVLQKSSFRIYYNNITFKEINITNSAAHLLGQTNQPNWHFNRDPRLAFPIFKLKGNRLEENYVFERDLTKLIQVYDCNGQLLNPQDCFELPENGSLELPEVWADYILTDSETLDLRDYISLENINQKTTHDNQISFNLDHLTKMIYVLADGIESITTDIFSIDGVKEYDIIHFLNETTNRLEFKLIEDENINCLPECEYSRKVNFKFKRTDNNETVIIIISHLIIDFSRIRNRLK